MISSAVIIGSFPESVLSFRGRLIESMQAAGVRVHVATPDCPVGHPQRCEMEAKGIHVHNVPLQRARTNPFSDVRTLFCLWRLLRSLRVDLVLSYTIKPVIYGSLAAWLAAVPHRFALITGVGFAFTGQRKGVVPALIRLMYSYSLGKVEKTFFQNCDDLDLFRSLGILRSDQKSVVVNGSGVDLDEFPVQALPLDSGAFLMIGRLLGDKGVREYVSAARIVRKTHPKARFFLAGWIDENPDAISQTELEEWIADDTIRYLGRLTDVRPAIQSTCVYVLPSYREGTPRTVLEAMAMGRPIITTNVPGCRETVVNGENGFLVSIKAVDELANAMARFIDFPDIAVRMGQRSRQIAEEKYDVHKINARMLDEMGIRPRFPISANCPGPR
jgi:glycosyltransferase involved in cell wall biosynthesis